MILLRTERLTSSNEIVVMLLSMRIKNQVHSDSSITLKLRDENEKKKFKTRKAKKKSQNS